VSKSADSIAARQAVYGLLRRRFPADAVAWTKTVRWDPLEKVDLDRFDTQDEANWAAYTNPDHVQLEVEQYKAGENKPLIAVQPPGADAKILIIDGHHRYLARERMHKSRVLAYVGHVPQAEGPWLDTHLSQKGGDSG
jgi:hypothetical protein